MCIRGFYALSVALILDILCKQTEWFKEGLIVERSLVLSFKPKQFVDKNLGGFNQLKE